MFKECADIQTADMLKLPVPALVGGKPTNIQLKSSEIQKQMVTELGERADKIRNKMVKPYEDNMLKITNDGRKLALDQRLIDPDLPDDPDSKVNICVGKILRYGSIPCPNAVRSLFSAICLRPRQAFSMSTMT